MSLHASVFRLFEKYATLLERQFSKRFKDVKVYHQESVASLLNCSFLDRRAR